MDVRRAAVRIIEGANLLMTPGRQTAPAGTKSETPGVELEPAEITALINRNRPGFNSFATTLRSLGWEALRASEAKSTDALFDIGGRMQEVCEGCHQAFWYPNASAPTPTRRAGSRRDEMRIRHLKAIGPSAAILSVVVFLNPTATTAQNQAMLENALGRTRPAGNLDRRNRYAAPTPRTVCEPGILHRGPARGIGPAARGDALPATAVRSAARRATSRAPTIRSSCP